MIDKIPLILVAVARPGDRDQPVVQRAAQLAETLRARVVLFHSVFESYLSGRPFFDSTRLAKSRGWMVAQRTRALARHAATLQKSGIEVETCVVWEEPAHEAIVRAAIRFDAGLVIAGSHASDQEGGWTLTDWELLRLCPRALLLVQSQPGSHRGPVLTALDPTHANDKPATLDVTLASYGTLLAQALGVDLHAIHCVSRSAYPLGEVTAADRKRMRDRRLVRIRTALKKADATDAKTHIVQGEVEVEVPKFAAQLDAQILILGAISRRGLQRFAIGNTAERLIHATPCDLLILKPRPFKFRLGKVRKAAVIMPKEKS